MSSRAEHASPEERKIRATCPECGPNRWANVVGHFSRRQEDDIVWAHTDYRILQCPACETVYFHKDSVFSEDWEASHNAKTGEAEYDYVHKIEQWPTASTSIKRRPDWTANLYWVDSDIDSLFSSVYVALEHNLPVLAAIGIRTTFDRASELNGVDPAKNFGEKLIDLVSLGKIGADERVALDALTDAANAAAHRGWKPTDEELETMLSFLEAFLYRTLILGDAAKKLKERVPSKPKRKKESKSAASPSQNLAAVKTETP